MNSRQRVKLALDHKEADHIPFDLGGTVLTSIHVNAYRNLRRYLGLPDKEVEVMDVFQQIAVVDDDVRQRLGCDCRNVAPRSSATFKIVVDEESLPGYRFFYDEWGIGWRMPKDGGFYYDMYSHPFSGSTDIEDIKKFPWPNPVDPARFTGLAERARHVADVQGEPVILGGLAAGFVELAAWTRRLRQVLSRPGHQPRVDDLPDGHHHRPQAGLLGDCPAHGRRLRRRGAGGRRPGRPVRAADQPGDLSQDHQAAPQEDHGLHQGAHQGQDLLPLLRRHSGDHPRPHRDRRGHHQPGAGERGGHGVLPRSSATLARR